MCDENFGLHCRTAHKITIPFVRRGETYVLTVHRPNFSPLSPFPVCLSLSPLYFLFASGEPAKSRSAFLSYGRKRDDWIYSSHGSTTVQKSYTTWIISDVHVSTYVREVGVYFSGGIPRFLSRFYANCMDFLCKTAWNDKNATRRAVLFNPCNLASIPHPTIWFLIRHS